MQTTRRYLLLMRRKVKLGLYYKIQTRNRSITGHAPTDVALKTVTGGRIDRWMQAYEDFVGLTEVKQAQSHVIQAETRFLAVQEDRRRRQQTLESIHSKLRVVSSELEKTSRADARYLELVQKEHTIIREENEVVSTIHNLEREERESFAVLSSALRDSHEKERARTEKTKYWSIIGSIIGAVIGITGSTLNNYLKMKEMRSLVTRAGENSEDLRSLSAQLCESVRSQSQKMDNLLLDLHSSLHSSLAGDQNPKATAMQLDKIKFSALSVDVQQQTEKVLSALKAQEESLDSGIGEIRRLLGLEKSQVAGLDQAVVYVGPEVESILRRTEENLERKIKFSALASATLVYTGLALTLPILYSFFKGS